MDTHNPLAGLSRRRLLVGGAATMALAAGAMAETVSQTPAVSGLAEPLPAEIKVTANHLTIDVKINGQGPFRFVIDTGADRSIIAADLAQSLGLVPGRQVLVEGIVQSLLADTVPVGELSFGSVVCTDLRMPVLARSLVLADGYLGLDTIGGHRVVFDFARQVMEVGEPLPPSFLTRLRPNETRVPAPGRLGHLRSVDCRVEGIPTVAFIDSGAEVSAGNEKLLAALVERNPAYSTTRPITLSGITGGSRAGRVVKVQSVTLQNLEFSGCELAIADLQVFDIWGLLDEPALLIGLNFLREFSRVTIDYGRKDIRLILADTSRWVTRRT